MAPITSLSITQAFARARGYLASDAALTFHIVGVTYSTIECGLVHFSLVDGEVVGQEVAA